MASRVAIDASEVHQVRVLVGERVFIRSGLSVKRPCRDYRGYTAGVRGYDTQGYISGYFARVQPAVRASETGSQLCCRLPQVAVMQGAASPRYS